MLTIGMYRFKADKKTDKYGTRQLRKQLSKLERETFGPKTKSDRWYWDFGCIGVKETKVVEVECEKNTHRVQLDKRGRLRLIDHTKQDIEERLALTAFGAEASCRCIEILFRWITYCKGATSVLYSIPKELREELIKARMRANRRTRRHKIRSNGDQLTIPFKERASVAAKAIKKLISTSPVHSPLRPDGVVRVTPRTASVKVILTDYRPDLSTRTRFSSYRLRRSEAIKSRLQYTIDKDKQKRLAEQKPINKTNVELDLLSLSEMASRLAVTAATPVSKYGSSPSIKWTYTTALTTPLTMNTTVLRLRQDWFKRFYLDKKGMCGGIIVNELSKNKNQWLISGKLLSVKAVTGVVVPTKRKAKKVTHSIVVAEYSNIPVVVTKDGRLEIT